MQLKLSNILYVFLGVEIRDVFFLLLFQFFVMFFDTFKGRKFLVTKVSRFISDRHKMQLKMIYAYPFVLICLCFMGRDCWARSKHIKEWVTTSGSVGKEVDK